MKAKVTFKGGPGSGHHNHSGRPGKRGGSLPGSGGGSSEPSNMAEHNLRNNITATADMISSSRPDIHSFDSLVLEHGEFFTPPQEGEGLPDWCDKGEMKQCYYNASMAVVGAPEGVYYTEGYASVQGLEGFPIQHGWLTDSKGNVIDPTWDDGRGTAYYGIRMNTDYVVDVMMETGMAGVIVNDYLAGNTIAKNGLPEEALP